MAVPSNDFFEKSRFSYKMAAGPASLSRTTYMVISGRVATFHFTSVICICSSSMAVMHPGCTQLPAFRYNSPFSGSLGLCEWPAIR